MKPVLTVWLGGPFHGLTDWAHDPQECIMLMSLKEFGEHGFYRCAFGDEYVLIYYWNINEFQKRAIEMQVVQLRAQHNELAVA